MGAKSWEVTDAFWSRVEPLIVVAGRKLTIYRGEFRLKFDQGV